MASSASTISRRRRAPERSRLKRAVVWGVLFGVVACAIWFLFLRGGQEPRRIELPQPGEVSTGTGTEVPQAPAQSGKHYRAPVETFKVFAPKDPFNPLVEIESDAPTDGAKGAVASSDTSESDGSLAGDHSVKLLEILGAESVLIEVDGTEYDVVLGDTFADSFQVVAIGDSCVSLLYGDEQLTVC